MPWVECINPHQLLELTTLESRSTTDGDADGADAGIVHDHSASNDDSGAVAGIPLPLVQSQDGGGSGIECSGTGGGGIDTIVKQKFRSTLLLNRSTDTPMGAIWPRSAFAAVMCEHVAA